MQEHVTVIEQKSKRSIKANLDKIVAHLVEGGVSTNEAKIMAPILLSILVGHMDLQKSQQQSSAEFLTSLLRMFERTKNHGYFLRRRAGGCCFSADTALQEAARDAQKEFSFLLGAKQSLDEAQLKNLEGMAIVMFRQFQMFLGDKQLKGAELLQKLMKDAQLIEGQVERLNEREEVNAD